MNRSNGPLSIGSHFLALACLLSLVGCRSGIYSARTLPAEFAAHPAIDMPSLDLAAIGGNRIRHDGIYAGDRIDVLLVTGTEPERPEAWEVRVAEDGAV